MDESAGLGDADTGGGWQAAHCPDAGSCPGISSYSDLSKCLGDPLETSSYYGLQPSELAGEVGFADFLFTLDSPVVVRGGEVLETSQFLDAQTTYFSTQVPLHLLLNPKPESLNPGPCCSLQAPLISQGPTLSTHSKP